MRFVIVSDSKMELRANGAEIKLLHEYKEENGQDYLGTVDAETNFFENAFCNSEYNWVSPEETGDLTDAPMIGVYDNAGEKITHRWAYMDYQVSSILEELLEYGCVTLEGGAIR